MHFSLMAGVLVLSCARLGCCDTCFNALSVLEVDAHMEHHVYRKVRSPSVYSCASECLMSSVCMSFNFETRTRICGLNRNSSDKVAITSQPGFLYSDISNWPKSLAGACSNTACRKSRCHVDRLNRASCESEFQGCGAPPTVANAEVHYDGVYEGAVAEYTCRDNFMLCATSNSSVCQSTGTWNGSVGPCAQYIWDSPGTSVELNVPCGKSRNFVVAVHVTPIAVAKIIMDFRGGRNILCHISFRLDDNTVVFGSLFADAWGPGATLSPVPIKVGTESLVEVRLHHEMFMISVDGSNVYNLTDRYPNEVIDHLYINNKAIVSAAYYSL